MRRAFQVQVIKGNLPVNKTKKPPLHRSCGDRLRPAAPPRGTLIILKHNTFGQMRTGHPKREPIISEKNWLTSRKISCPNENLFPQRKTSYPKENQVGPKKNRSAQKRTATAKKNCSPEETRRESCHRRSSHLREKPAAAKNPLDPKNQSPQKITSCPRGDVVDPKEKHSISCKLRVFSFSF